MTGKYLIFRQNCGMITAERVASAVECRKKIEKISAIFAAKLESNKLSGGDESLLPEEKKKYQNSSKQVFEDNTHRRHGHNRTEALQHYSFAALISPLRPVQWQQMTNGFRAFPGQDTNSHPPKAFSRHLMLHQSKCQVLETKTGGNFTSGGVVGVARVEGTFKHMTESSTRARTRRTSSSFLASQTTLKLPHRDFYL